MAVNELNTSSEDYKNDLFKFIYNMHRYIIKTGHKKKLKTHINQACTVKQKVWHHMTRTSADLWGEGL